MALVFGSVLFWIRSRSGCNGDLGHRATAKIANDSTIDYSIVQFVFLELAMCRHYCDATLVAFFSEVWYFRIALKSASAIRCR